MESHALPANCRRGSIKKGIRLVSGLMLVRIQSSAFEMELAVRIQLIASSTIQFSLICTVLDNLLKLIQDFKVVAREKIDCLGKRL